MQTQLFADDTIVFNSGTDMETLIASTNEELIKLHDWTQANKLTIHGGKTKLLIVSNRVTTQYNPSISFTGNVIYRTNCCKYLGVYL